MPEHGRLGPPASQFQAPMLTTCEIGRGGSRLARMGGQEYALTIEGQQAARIATRLRSDVALFQGTDRLRRTSVDLADRTWTIEAVEPGPRPTRTTAFGTTKEIRYPKSSRVVNVFHRNEPIAKSEGLIADDKLLRDVPFTVIAGGKRFTLLPPWKSRQGGIDEHATLRRGIPWYSTWSLTAVEPVPLSVVLLHWHVLLGDFRKESHADWLNQ